MNTNKSKINYYDTDKENVKNNNFTKLTRSGISLIVLVITIIVIIILAAAIIISLNNNNPIMEANTARYESDRANMQAVFTNAVSKVMAKNQATVSVSAGQINTVTGGVAEIDGQVAYTLTDAQNESNATGTIVFDKGSNTDTKFYTGKKLPIYAAGDTKWYVDSEGNISLEVAGTKYGSGEIVKPGEVTLITGSDFNALIPREATSVEFLSIAAPTDVEIIDVSEAKDGSVLAWSKDNKFYVAPKKAGEIICANSDSSNMFKCANYVGSDGINTTKNFVNINFENFNTHKVTNMEEMFYGLGTSYNNYVGELTALENWNVSSVTNMKSMFYGTFMLDYGSERNLDLSGWNVENVENLSWMFYSVKFATLNLSGWNTSKVTDMSGMFKSSNLHSLNISDWNTENVTSMSWMFSGLGVDDALIQGLENFNTSNVTDMSYMFEYCMSSTKNFNISVIENWNVSNVTTMSYMFKSAGSQSETFNLGEISKWNTSNVESMSNMFSGAGRNADYTLDLSGWDVSKVIYHSYFKDAGVESKIISPWD